MQVRVKTTVAKAATVASLYVLVSCMGAGASELSSVDLVTAANRTSRLCRAGNLDEASRALREIHILLVDLLGASHPSSRAVRLYFESVERTQGREPLSPSNSITGGSAKIEPALKRAIRKLSACLLVQSVDPGICSGVKAADHLRHAGIWLQRCRYEKAYDAIQCAEKAAPEIGNAQISPNGPSARAAKERELFLLNLRHRRALVLARLGKQQEALEAARAGSASAVKISDLGFRVAFARMLAQLGDLQRARAELDAVEVALANRAADPDDAAVNQAAASRDATVRGELETARAVLALLLGSPRDALRYLDRSLESIAPPAATTSAVSRLPLADVLRLQGDASRLAGDFPRALASYTESRRLFEAADRESPDRGKCGTASVVSAIGQLRLDLGDPRFPESSRSFFVDAEMLFGEAEQILRDELGPTHLETLTAAANRAVADYYLDLSEQKKTAYVASIEKFCQALPPGHRDCAAVLRNWSDIELDSQNLKRAEELLARALEAQLKLGPSHPDVAVTRLQRGRLLAHQGKHEDAAIEIDGAIRVLAAARGPEHPTVIRARTRRARNAVAQGDDATALQQSTEALHAMAAFTRRTFGALTERQRAALSQDSRAALGALLSIPSASAREVTLTIMPHRDSVLRSIDASRSAARATEKEPKLESLRRQYAETVAGAGPDAAARAAEIASEIDRITAVAASLGVLKPAEVLVRACERLAGDSALVKFVNYDRTQLGATDHTTPTYAALVVKPVRGAEPARGDGCKIERVDLGVAQRIDEPAAVFGRAMRQSQADSPVARAELSAALLEPLQPLLAGINRWLVIPDGAIWGVPLGVLPDPEQPDRYLLERVTVGYLTSMVELSDASLGELLATGNSLLIGSPDYDASQGGEPIEITDADPCGIPSFVALPSTSGEIEDIASLVPSPRVLVGVDATELQLAQALREQPSLIHFATHAYFAGAGECSARYERGPDDRRDAHAIEADPLMLSGIAMAGANHTTQISVDPTDGILTSYEIAGLDMRSADLVVLSACDTGTGVHLRGQEIQGLRWGFRAAGARALVTSLWLANDYATRRMMRSFYQALYTGQVEGDVFRGAEALRRAKLEYVKGEKRIGLRRPVIWGNFIFSGVI